MQKISLTYRVLSFILAALIFVSSVGFSVDLHYCSGEFMTLSFTGKAPSCHEALAAACPHHQKATLKGELDNKCCANKTLHFQSDSDKEFSKTTIDLPQPLQVFMVSYAQAFYKIWTSAQIERPVFNAYKPPPLLRDILVLVQAFLI